MNIVFSSDLIDIIDCHSSFGIPPWYIFKKNDFILDQPYFRQSKTISTSLHHVEESNSNNNNDNSNYESSHSTRKKKRRINLTDILTEETHHHLKPFLIKILDHLSTILINQPGLLNSTIDKERNNTANNNDDDNKVEERDMIQFPKWISTALAARRFQIMDNHVTLLDQGNTF